MGNRELGWKISPIDLVLYEENCVNISLSSLPLTNTCLMMMMISVSRCVLDTMRLVDLLLILLFEGRKALPKTGLTGATSHVAGLRRLDSAGERSHRQLIDCIRSKDTDALIDAIDNGSKWRLFAIVFLSVYCMFYEVN